MKIGLFIPCYIDHVRDNFDAIEQTDEVRAVRARTFELVEFLHDIQKVDALPWARFPHRVGLYNSCGTLRRLKHARPSELHEPFFSKPLDLLSKVDGIEFVQPVRPDECCGFGIDPGQPPEGRPAASLRSLVR